MGEYLDKWLPEMKAQKQSTGAESIGAIIRRVWPGVNLNTTSAPGSKPAPIRVKCQICRDQGWVYPGTGDGKIDFSHPRRCECMKQPDFEKRQLEFLKYCELPAETEDRTFAAFKPHTPGLKTALQGGQEVAAGKRKLLVLASGVDRGKTHLAIAICREWLRQGKSAKYAFVPLLLDELRAGFQKNDDHSFDSRFTFYQRVGLLVLDDLGAEVKTAWAVEKLESIIDYRWINNLATVVTTNCGMDEFSDRIRSRLQRWRDGLIIAIEDSDAPEYTRVKRRQRK